MHPFHFHPNKGDEALRPYVLVQQQPNPPFKMLDCFIFLSLFPLFPSFFKKFHFFLLNEKGSFTYASPAPNIDWYLFCLDWNAVPVISAAFPNRSDLLKGWNGMSRNFSGKDPTAGPHAPAVPFTSGTTNGCGSCAGGGGPVRYSRGASSCSVALHFIVKEGSGMVRRGTYWGRNKWWRRREIKKGATASSCSV